ncbi:MAG: MFS transporter [Acidimicrobiia bacterium]
MSTTRLETSSAITAARGLFAALGLLMLGNGLLGTLLGIRSEIEGFATAATGVIMASYYAGFLLASRMIPRTLERVGHVRVFAALASMASASPLVHSVFVTPAVWSAMRFVFGFCMAGLYVVSESWLNQNATNETRGRLLSVYMVVMMGGLGVSQLFLGVAPPEGFRLFVLASLFVSLAVVPITLSQGKAPPFHAIEPLKASALWKLAPLGIVGGFGVGITNGALIGIGPVYATRVGFGTGEVALIMGAALAGSVLLQWPIGHMSDRTHRRQALLLVTGLAAGVAALGSFTDAPGITHLMVVMFLFGGLTFPMYSIALSHISDVVGPNSAVSASALYAFVGGIGAIVGPIAAALSLDSVGPTGFFIVMAATHALVGIFALYQIVIVDPPVTPEQQKPWIPIPARASAVVTRLAKVRRTGNGRSKPKD